METITVTLRREILKRLDGDSVVHWVATAKTPPRVVRARSIHAVERMLRKKLAVAASTVFVFELQSAPPATQEAIATSARALAEAAKAIETAATATREAVRLLLLGPPTLSVREVAKLLGLPKSKVQRIAAECAGADAKARRRLRLAERESALAALRAAARPPGYVERDRAPWKTRMKERVAEAQRNGLMKPFEFPSNAGGSWRSRGRK